MPENINWATNATLAATADEISTLEESAETYRIQLDLARSAMRYVESAFSVLQREIQWNSDPIARERALGQLTEASRSASEIADLAVRYRDVVSVAFHLSPTDQGSVNWHEVTALPWSTSMSAFSFRGMEFSVGKSLMLAPIVRYEPSIFEYTVPLLDAPTTIDFATFLLPSRVAKVEGQAEIALPTSRAQDAHETFDWRAIRDSLQQHFSVPLDRLANLIGIAYPTLVNLGRRRPHPSTSRSVLRLHALTKDFDRSRGLSDSMAWFATDGLDVLEKRGFDSLKRAAIRELYGRQSGTGGVPTRSEPDLSPASEATN